MSDDNSSVGASDETSDSENEPQSGPMMSIFASYYGIEESAEQNDQNSAASIDNAKFNPNSFVKVFLI
jgi:hypothetical protein